MQSFVTKKKNQRWLWHGIDRYIEEVLAYVLGSRTYEMFLQLKKLLKPFGITKFYTDGLKTYERHIAPEIRQVSKYKMQKIERKHLTLRTRKLYNTTTFFPHLTLSYGFKSNSL